MSAKKILVIDDDPRVVAVLSARLQRMGYQIASADCAISGIAVARREQPDLVVLDLSLPAGDGFVIMSRMRQLAGLAKLPIIVLSGSAEPADKQRALQTGAHAFVQKASGGQEFVGAVRSALGERPAVDAFMRS